MALSAAAFAHPELGDYLQHRIALGAAPDRIDLAIEITFDGERSLHERKSIDTDGDGALSQSERKAYLDRVHGEAERCVRLSIDGKPARLIALFGPELDLLNSGGAERHAHILRLTFFAPAPCPPGAVVTIEDALWPDAPAILLAGQDGASVLKCVPRQPPAPDRAAGPAAARAVAFDIAAPQPAQTATRASQHTHWNSMRSKGRPAVPFPEGRTKHDDR